ncbi:MAG: hypothetical protein R2849_21480 [Thermomicrobiales bacterium]
MPDYTLPYRTDWQDMAAVLDYAKGSGAERAALDARFRRRRRPCARRSMRSTSWAWWCVTIPAARA